MKEKLLRYLSLRRAVILAVIAVVAAVVTFKAVFAAMVTVDGTVSTVANVHDGTSPTTVFISDQVGYIFYRDSTNACVWTKTTDGGSTWSAAVNVVDNSCHHIAVWYDRWTPGDNTGNYIYTASNKAGVNDIMYNRFDTTNDTLQMTSAAPTNITDASSTNKTNTFVSDDNYETMTKGTDGTLYVGVEDSGTTGDQSYIIKCSTSCSTGSNWSDTGIVLPQDPDAQAKNNALLIEPQSGGDLLAISFDQTNLDILSKVYHFSTSTWDSTWVTVDNNAANNTTYAGDMFSAVVDRRNFNVYMSYMHNATTPGTDDDIQTATYSGGAWTRKTDVLTNDAKGLLVSQIAMDQNTGNIYVAYTARTTPATATTANEYWKKSTDGMTTWGTEQGPLNTSSDDLWGIRLNVMSRNRIFADWTDAATSSTSPRALNSNTLETLSPPSYTQAIYRLFGNANSTDVGSPLAASNTAASLSSPGAAFRVRMLLKNTGGNVVSGVDDMKLQYAGKGAGTCASPSGTPSSYTDVTTSTAIAYNDNSTPTDGSNLTANANDPTNGADTIVNQTYEEANDFTTTSGINTNQDGKWDFSLKDNSAPSGTSYCLRVVQADGTVLPTYSQYPEISTAVTNTAPNSPTSLQQKKTDDTVLATGAWVNQNSIKFTASATDPDSSDTLQLCVEKKPIGTSFSNTEDLCGTGVAYSGSAVTPTVTITGITDATEYHWQARLKDAAGAYSSWVSYDTNAETARDFGIDTTAPTGGTVYDGTTTGSDAALNGGSLSSLSANWSGFNANVSGLARYDYSIGTTAGGTDVVNWTSNGTSTTVTANSLSLQTSKMYYFNVRAVDNAGNVQSAVSSDGQLITPTLSFGLSAGSLSFANLNAGNSYTDTKTTTVTTSTNAYNGYVIRAFMPSVMTLGSRTIGDFSGGSYATPDSWQSGDTGMGYTSSDTSVQGTNLFQASPCLGGSSLAAPGCYAPFSHTAPGDIVADNAGPVTGSAVSGEQFTITYRVTTSSSQQAGQNYGGSVVYSVVPIY